MAVVVIATTPGMSAELYDQSQEVMDLVGRLPERCSAHIAGPSPQGWRVVTVWETADAARQFMTERLQPALATLGVDTPADPPVVYPLHVLNS